MTDGRTFFLWSNDALRNAFQRWWDEDWSWEKLVERDKPKSIVRWPWLSWVDGKLSDVWRDEADHLIDFGGRKWTAFHLPPCDRNGVLCPNDVWASAKNLARFEELVVRLAQTKPPTDARLDEHGLAIITNYASLCGVVFPEGFAFPEDRPTGIAADFTSSIFLDYVKWHSRIAACFDGAIFCRDAFFERATFCKSTGRFSMATFMSDARFDNATFNGYSWFMETHFDRAFFQGAAFDDSVWFNRATFTGDANFEGRKPFRGSANFEGVTFLQDADFSNRTFDDHTTFNNARFAGIPQFAGAVLHPDTDFASATFLSGEPPSQPEWFDEYLAIDRIAEPRPSRRRRHLVSSYREAMYSLRRMPPLCSLRMLGMAPVRRAHDRATASLENAYRCLRELCHDIGNGDAEATFHALELRCHRARTNARPLDRFASLLYEWLSDYGQSTARPLIWLTACWAAVAILYSWLFQQGTCGLTHASPSAGELIVAAGRQFLPSLFTPNVGAAALPSWFQCLAAENHVAFFFIGLVQTLLLITGVTLFVIALRRRFRIRQS